jgi:hypothetical protein
VALGAIPIVAAITIASRFVNIMFTCSAVKSFTWLCVMKTLLEIATVRFRLLDSRLSWCEPLGGDSLDGHRDGATGRVHLPILLETLSPESEVIALVSSGFAKFGVSNVRSIGRAVCAAPKST